ncbi:ABC transporter ATP-binding protein [Pseudonocardia humida]|uniref:ABC transporter ATP-binding protein n=1 Tax=Pseudonocardia humida TaxID=2800819 RepID=A0ABT0ZWT8_9PSEU|nr:ABC transporter ATP-binding protein [Pseudonocardia humida]MCO1655145.1 ABC transporter ATP-binding protein [Pseudonocardia humida]
MSLDIAGLHVALGGRDVVDGVDLAVDDGELVGLIGPNGSGKTTLLRTVYRALRPHAGRVLVDRDDVWALPPRESARRTAAVLQEGGDGFDYDVGEFVALGRAPLRERGGHPETVRAVAEALDRVGLAGAEHRLVASLSGGERQRVLLARALAQRPRLLVLDEPTNHLDVRHQLDLVAMVRALGLTTLLTLHQLDLAAWCDRLVVLDGGRVVADGTPAEVLTPQTVAAVFDVDAAVVTHPRTGRPHLLFSTPDLERSHPCRTLPMPPSTAPPPTATASPTATTTGSAPPPTSTTPSRS